MARRLPSVRVSWLQLVWVLVLGGILLAASVPRSVVAIPSDARMMVPDFEGGAGGEQEYRQPGDDDQPTISGRKYQRSVGVNATPAPSAPNIGQARLDPLQDQPVAPRRAARGFERFQRFQFFLRSWWMVLR